MKKTDRRKSQTGNMKNNLMIFTAVVVTLFIALTLRLAYISLIRHDYYRELATSQQLRDTIISADRGTIYDTNMNVLARSATVWTVALDPKHIKKDDKDQTKDDREKISVFLSEVLDVPYETVRSKCDEDSYYSIVKRKVDKPVKDQIEEFIKENKISGITFTQDTKRYYPYGNLASQVIGFVGTDNNGLYGLEAYYERYLSGLSGRILTAVNANGKDMYYQMESVTEAEDGYNLVLTIDTNIQRYLEQALEEAVKEHNIANYACGIVMNVNDGSIYAMSSKPDFDPNDPLEIYTDLLNRKLEGIEDADEYLAALSKAQEFQWRNKAISDIYEPGSVFKVVTASAALESGTCTTESRFTCYGSTHITGSIYISDANSRAHGDQDFTHATINSCNSAFIQIGLAMGRETFYNYFKAFGLTEKTGIDLPAESSSSYYKASQMGPVELASCSFGQSNAITPIQLITAFAAAVNGGYLVEPHVVREILDTEGNIVEQKNTSVRRQVISEETSRTMCQVLEQVAENSNAYVSGFRLGGKSGTAEKLNSDTNDYVASFCAFGPTDSPEVICLILYDGAHSYSIFGGNIVAPVVASVMSYTLPYIGVEAVYSDDEMETVDVYEPWLNTISLTNAKAQLQKKGLNYKVVGDGTVVVSQSPQGGIYIPKGSTVFLYTDDSTPKTVTVPDVKGYTVSYVRSVFESLGLNIKTSGSSSNSAEVMSQSVAAGESVPEGTVIELGVILPDMND
ncbi:MAG: PASTA domain-containing protein [Oscillospiraceae bacterium]|nr:PASTA domain-containing protein [Oscillospiraceae bacterium]